MWKKIIPHRDCRETGAITNYVSNIAFLYEIYRENANFRFKKNGLVKFRKNYKYLYGYCFSNKKMGGHRLNI